MKRATILAAVALVSGCVANPEHARQTVNTHTVAPYQRVAFSGTLEAAVRSKFETFLRDPESLRFRGVRAASTTLKTGGRSTIVCGEYNARNGFGGYAGFEPFAAEVVNGSVDAFAQSSQVANVCAAANL